MATREDHASVLAFLSYSKRISYPLMTEKQIVIEIIPSLLCSDSPRPKLITEHRLGLIGYSWAPMFVFLNLETLSQQSLIWMC